MKLFHLTEKELEDGFSAINHHGYSAMLPEPLEWQVIKDNWENVKDYIKNIDLDEYKPFKTMKIFAPKNRANIRVVNLLHPQDLIIYTSLVLIIKNDIEKNRISKGSKRVFSYRVVISKDDRLYDARGAHESYLKELHKKTLKTSTKFVGIADIADFYPRIYQHRLENVVQSIATTQRGVEVARVLIKKLISNLMEKNSYGIPVGPYASRILGEALLIDVDAHLHSNKIDFVRWVDDYNIFCKSEYEAQFTLFTLGEWLFSQHGLTLQSAKTKILTSQAYLDEVLIKPEENLSDRDHAIAFLKDFKALNYDSEELEDDLEDDEDQVQSILEQMQGFDLQGMLRRSISDKALVDFEVVNYVLTRLPRMPETLNSMKLEVLNLVIDNAELLYPSSEQIAKFLVSFKDIPKAEKKKIGKKLLKPLVQNKKPPPTYYAMWMLYIFTTSEDWNQIKEIILLYQRTTSEVVKRYAALAIATSGSRNEAILIKDDFSSASDVLRLAILKATNNLGKDERNHWKLSQQINGIIEKIM